MLFTEAVNEDGFFSNAEVQDLVLSALEKIHKKERICIVPPDITRFHSHAGRITGIMYNEYSGRITDIIPALGTHYPMTPEELDTMYPGIPHPLFRDHNWREDLSLLGTVPGTFVKKETDGIVSMDWPAQVNSLLQNGRHDLILSVGQVVPHEVMGMANYTKNIFVGLGGKEGINRSHYIGATYGMERIMGRARNPVRNILNHARNEFARHLPIVYVLTVVAKNKEGAYGIKGLFIGDDDECFYKAADLSQKVNLTILEQPLDTALVYLDPAEYKSTWLGNKAIYRMRLAMADNGHLVIIGPGVSEFGEDETIDKLIRKYGYHGTSAVLDYVKQDNMMSTNLGVPAHLIHGSTEGRFNVTWCPGHISREEIEKAGFNYADYHYMSQHFSINSLKEGYNTTNNGTVYYNTNPGAGLWAVKNKLKLKESYNG